MRIAKSFTRSTNGKRVVSQRPEKTNSTSAVVDLFCGVGGLSLGLKNSGLSIAAGIDIDLRCKFPYENNVDAKFLKRDISDVSVDEVLGLFGTAALTVLAACAPCQPFSGYTSTYRTNENSRWNLLEEVVRIAEGARPKYITIENVPRLAKLELWQESKRRLERAGYFIDSEVIDCSDLGVPQRRKRLVLVASLLGPIDLPSRHPNTLESVRNAISSLRPLEAGESDPRDRLHTSRRLGPKNLRRIQMSTPGGTWRDWPRRLQTNCHKKSSGKTYPSVYGRMSWDKPSPTITTQFYGYGNGRFGHPEQDRALTLREGALLQTFPMTFRFLPDTERINFTLLGKYIGNAVPPALAFRIGAQIKNHYAASCAFRDKNSSRSK